MLIRILRSPYFLSAVGMIVIFIIILPELPKYSIKPTEHITDAGGEGQYVYVYDLDDDGKSEFVRFKTTSIGKPAVVVSHNIGNTVDQWNFNGEFRDGSRFSGMGDYDSNGLGEVYFLTIYNGALILNFVEPMRQGQPDADSIKICDFRQETEVDDIYYSFNRMADLDGDGYQEIIVTVKVGYGIYPRGVYLVNLKEREVSFFSRSYNALFYSELFDIDNDGKPELFFNSSSSANSNEDLPPGENDNYINGFVLDPDKPQKYDDLFCVFSPLGKVRMIPFMAEYDTLILAIANVKYCKSPIAYFWKNNGEFLDSLVMEIDEYPDGWHTRIIKHKFNEELMISSPKGHVYTIDKKRRLVRAGDFQKNSRFCKSMDINEDGVREYIRVFNENILLIYSDDLHTKSKIEIPRVDFSQNQLKFSKYYYNGEPFLFVQNGSLTKCYKFGKNWLFWGQYPLAVLAILVLWMFIYLIQHQQRIIFERKQKAMDEISKLEFQAIANQINPHFSYNILNTIGYSILHDDSTKAYKLLVKYSSLTRNLIEGGVQADRTLRQETGFVESYLELQKSRFEDSFHFYIEIDPVIDQEMLVPRMIILTFVENALIHGLAPKSGDKSLKVKVYPKDSEVFIEVVDNGVGREASDGNEMDSTGQGLGILDRIIDIHRKLHKKHISYEIVDLKDKDATGTKVVVNLEV